MTSDLREKPMKILVTNAASKTAYSFLPLLCNGDVFGEHQKLEIILFAFKPLIEEVETLESDLLECCYPLLDKITTVTDVRKAFKGIDVAILLELERNIIGFKNNSILFRAYGLLLNAQANKNVKVLVCGRTANTSAFVCSSFAPSISPHNFTVLAQNVRHFLKATMKMCSATGVGVSNYPYFSSSSGFADRENLRNDLSGEFGKEDILTWGSCSHPIISAPNKNGHLQLKDIKLGLKNPGPLVTAKAMAEHLNCWLGKSHQSSKSDMKVVCMGVVIRDNHLGIENNLYFNLPVQLEATNSDPLEYSSRLEKDNDLVRALGEASDRLVKERDSAIVDCWRVVLPHSHM